MVEKVRVELTFLVFQTNALTNLAISPKKRSNFSLLGKQKARPLFWLRSGFVGNNAKHRFATLKFQSSVVYPAFVLCRFHQNYDDNAAPYAQNNSQKWILSVVAVVKRAIWVCVLAFLNFCDFKLFGWKIFWLLFLFSLKKSPTGWVGLFVYSR